MNSMSEAELYAALAAVIGTYLIVFLAAVVFRIVVWWRIFSKAGEAGWKGIIPVYCDYTIFKISWKPVFFWITIGLSVVAGVLSSIATAANAIGNVSAVAVICALLMIVIYVAIAIIYIIQTHKLSKSFGHGVGFTLGLIFLHPIFLLILAFGSSEYQGADL